MTDTIEWPAAGTATSAATGGFIWYELMSPDPLAAKAFYDAVVGWNIDDHSTMTSGDADYRMINRSDGGFAGGVLKLDDEMRRHGARPIWLGYLHVADVDSAVKAIVADGGKTMISPFDTPGVGRMAMAADPQGAVFYLMTPTPSEGQPDAVSDVFSVDQAQHVRWNELMSDDPASAIDFYGRHFGWVQNGDMDMGELGKYRFLEHGGVMIGAVMPRMPQVPVSMWSYYFGVDDIDRAAKAVTANGGQIVQGPMEIPGGEFALNGTDPEGASFGLVGPRK